MSRSFETRLFIGMANHRAGKLQGCNISAARAEM
jgi:hypothetical protein